MTVLQIMGMMSNRDNIPRPDIPDRLDCLPGGTFDGMADYVDLMKLCWAEVRVCFPRPHTSPNASNRYRVVPTHSGLCQRQNKAIYSVQDVSLSWKSDKVLCRTTKNLQDLSSLCISTHIDSHVHHTINRLH